MGAAAVAAVLRRREREVVDDFRAAGATSRETAQSYTAIGLGQSLGLKRLRDRAVRLIDAIRAFGNALRVYAQRLRQLGKT